MPIVSMLLIKNIEECKHIPEEELFISESGYAYSVLEIASFIRGAEIFFQYKYEYETPGVFRDFKNTESEEENFLNRHSGRGYKVNLFSDRDIQELMSHTIICDAIDATKDYESLQKHILFLRKY